MLKPKKSWEQICKEIWIDENFLNEVMVVKSRDRNIWNDANYASCNIN